jgi:hypothetical protein
MFSTLGVALIRRTTTELRSRNTAQRVNNAAIGKKGEAERQKTADNRRHNYCKIVFQISPIARPRVIVVRSASPTNGICTHTVIAMRRYNNHS